ncbi:ABC transporter permease [Halosimplex halobium]|uniref:ABC transporter permease n=1 Tax=Halosimplex halobium TaxID=3396618 RepID=UPI003F553E5C
MSEESATGDSQETAGSPPTKIVDQDATHRTTRDRGQALVAVAQRAFDTVVRTRTYLAVAVVYGFIVVGLPVASGVSGYLPLVLDLLTPVEVLVPLVAFGFGSWSVLADARSGELDVIRTFPLDRSTYVLGTFLGRAVGLLAAVLAPLVVLGISIPFLREPATGVFASHATVDSPVYLVRFVALTAAYALVSLALAMAVSSLARSRRTVVAAATVATLAVVIGIDAAVILGLVHGIVGADSLGLVVALSPTGAFRGLILSTAVDGIVSTGTPAANAAASVAGLTIWFILAFVVATLAAWSSDE